MKEKDRRKISGQDRPRNITPSLRKKQGYSKKPVGKLREDLQPYRSSGVTGEKEFSAQSSDTSNKPSRQEADMVVEEDLFFDQLADMMEEGINSAQIGETGSKPLEHETTGLEELNFDQLADELGEEIDFTQSDGKNSNSTYQEVNDEDQELFFNQLADLVGKELHTSQSGIKVPEELYDSGEMYTNGLNTGEEYSPQPGITELEKIYGSQKMDRNLLDTVGEFHSSQSGEIGSEKIYGSQEMDTSLLDTGEEYSSQSGEIESDELYGSQETDTNQPNIGEELHSSQSVKLENSEDYWYNPDGIKREVSQEQPYIWGEEGIHTNQSYDTDISLAQEGDTRMYLTLDEPLVKPDESFRRQNETGNKMAISSTVLGIISLLVSCYYYLACPSGIVGLILGIISYRKNKNSNFAFIGILLNSISLIFVVLFVAYNIFFRPHTIGG